jgi:hypothetical protein
MHEGVTNVLGIEIPSTSPLFLSVVGVHVVAGLVAVVCGAIAIFSNKGRGRHARFGTYYYWSVVWTVGTASVLTALRFAENLDVMTLGVLCLGVATLGRIALQRRWRAWVQIHITSMGLSYILLLTAFYVENGQDLPLWDRLPVIAFWLLPGAVGLPIILLALRFHPLSQRTAAIERGAGGRRG